MPTDLTPSRLPQMTRVCSSRHTTSNSTSSNCFRDSFHHSGRRSEHFDEANVRTLAVNCFTPQSLALGDVTLEPLSMRGDVTERLVRLRTEENKLVDQHV